MVIRAGWAYNVAPYFGPMKDESKIWSELNDMMNNDRLEGPGGYLVSSSGDERRDGLCLMRFGVRPIS